MCSAIGEPGAKPIELAEALAALHQQTGVHRASDVRGVVHDSDHGKAAHVLDVMRIERPPRLGNHHHPVHRATFDARQSPHTEVVGTTQHGDTKQAGLLRHARFSAPGRATAVDARSERSGVDNSGARPIGDENETFGQMRR